MGQHNWSYNEDYTCCWRFFKFALDNDTDKNINELITSLTIELEKIPQSSVQMKISNIKYLCEKFKLRDKVKISSLSQYSEQCKAAFSKAFLNLTEEERLRLVTLTPPPPPPPPQLPEPPNPLNQEVISNIYGIGTVIDLKKIDETKEFFITVKFSNHCSDFRYPDAFRCFSLRFVSQELQSEIKEYLRILSSYKNK